MTHLCILQFMTLILHQVTLIMIYRKLVNKLFSEKWSLTHIPPNKLKKWYSAKKTVSVHPIVYFDSTPVNSTATHKHLGIKLDSKPSYENHLQSLSIRVNKTIDLLRKFRSTLPRRSLVTFCKPFTRSYLDYGDVDYDRASNESFHQSFESLKHSSAIAMTGAIRGTLSEKLFQELGLELIKSRRSLRNLCLLFKLIKKSPASLFQLIPDHNTTRRVQKRQFPFSNTKTKLFQKIFLSCSYNWK